jgi:transcriptional regulator with GAF, ATPase, and Fis domain
VHIKRSALRRERLGVEVEVRSRLPDQLAESLKGAAEETRRASTVSLRAVIDGIERRALTAALESARGNRAMAARLLSTTPRVFGYKVLKHKIDWQRFKR